MTTPTSPESNCVTCGGPHPTAQGFMPKHPFNDGSLSVSATFGKRRADGSTQPPKPSQDGSERASERPPHMLSAFPFDPVVRQALVDKGILTPEDLREAERKIQLVTSIFEGRTDGGESTGR